MGDESPTRKDGVKGLSRGRQIFLYIAPFPALAFFKIWAASGRAPGSLLAAACAMLIYCTCVLALARRWDKPTYFDWTVSAYFLVLSLSFALWPKTAGAILTEYAVTGIYACLFSAAFFPPILGFEPFTNHYAKKSAPRAVWETPIFLTINRIMTFSWAGLFATCVVLSLYPSVITRALIPIALILGVGVPFNLRFPDYYLRRLGLPGLAKMRKIELEGRHGTSVVSDTRTSPYSAPKTSDPFASELSRSDFSEVSGATGHSQLRKETIMKVLAINSSPRADGISKTGMLLDALVKGMRDAGADVETIHLRKKKVKNCIGCFTCWTKTPGVCVQKDDMTNELFPKWLEADLAVYATPLYHYTVNASMKALIERTLPVVEPFLNRLDDATSHPMRQKPPRAVVLSVAGFPEMSVFAQLTSYMNFLLRKSLVAEIYRPGAEMMSLPQFSETTKDILEATTQGGRELVQSMKISKETMERITRPISDNFDSVANMANLFWKSCIREGLTPSEFHQRHLIPRPDSIETFMMIMPMGFNSERAGDTRAVLQFNFSGEVEGSCHFKIENGKIEAKKGAADKPDLTVDSPFEVWMDVMTGKADGQQMFMQQKYKAVGDLSVLMRMKDLFGRGEK
ncbi:MAG: NAD(P)H-dependent oxidoreductase [Desulfomonilaceae bacterium]